MAPGGQGASASHLETMARAAALYYLEGATQAQVATGLGLSRARVGRLLKQARDLGIVEIRVHAPPAITERLETEMARRFGLRHVLLVPDHASGAVQRDLVAQRVAEVLLRHLRAGMVVAVGMGRNVGAVSASIGDAPSRACRFVAAIGGSPATAPQVDAGGIARDLAARFGGTGVTLYAPAYAESPAVRAAFLRHDDVRRTLDLAAGADVALVGIGDAEDDSAVVRMGCFSRADMRRMRAAGAVGDILGSFFDTQGRPVAAGMRDRVISLGFEELRRVAMTIGVAAEAGKARAILGALRSGVIEVLATSVANARQVLRLADEPV